MGNENDTIPKIPNLKLPSLFFLLQNQFATDQTKQQLLAGIKEKDMAPYYSHVCKTLGWPVDAGVLKSYEAKNAKVLKEMDEKSEDALKNLGETEYSDSLIAKALYLAEIGEKEKAIEAYEFAFSKTAPIGHRIDILFTCIRIGYFHQDNSIVQTYIERVEELIEKGGDWDRRNRLKVYKGIFLISRRQFKESVDFMLDTLATFTSSEFMEYRDFVRYAVLTASLILSRPDFKTRVLDAPEILECIHEIPNFTEYVNSFYSCQYASFFKQLAAVEKGLKTDVYLSQHYRYYVREMRIRVYGQVLESYKSVTIASLASSFGVTEEWIDSGRLNAVIDKVGEVVLTNRPDAKNAQYQRSIKEGDNLLNSIQKLSRVINV